MTTITPFLMFEGNAEEAMTEYVDLFKDSEIVSIHHYGPGEAGAEGSIRQALALIAGQPVMFIDSATNHDFTFTPAFSLFVNSDSEEEFTRTVNILGYEGKMLMPPDNYGFSRQFCWLNDRFGVSWQINLP